MVVPLLAVAVGIVLLMWSSDKFVEGAAALAGRLGVSQILIGMVIVGFGTSLPEMTVSALSSWEGASGIALGNAYGSNIANITLILGVAAVIAPIHIRSSILRQEMPILLAITAFAVLQLVWNAFLTRLDGVLLIAVFALSMYLAARNEHSKKDALEEEVEEDQAGKPDMSLGLAVTWVVVGLVVLVGSSRLLVWGAVETARMFGVSELTIGLTIVAIGTSLPELASSVAAARKNHPDIAVGNVIGSNMFNTLVVVGIAALVRPMTIAPELLRRDIPALCVTTIALFAMCIGWAGKPAIITRARGVALLVMFVAYTTWVAVSSVG